MSNLPSTKVIDPARWGVSFSLKQCRNLNIDQTETLQWLLDQGWRRFRLMSYWDEHEKQQGLYDFAALDTQIDQISAVEGKITLCLGGRQPRWPENHWPEWAWQTSKSERTASLFKYIEAVVKRYRDNPSIISYQLENEALLVSFGVRLEIDRQRLRDEFAFVKRLDPSTPILMSTSNAWGIPLRRPIPDIVGFSFYQSVYANNQYKVTPRAPWIDPLRAKLIRLLHSKATVIHELQCEPWGPNAIWEMSMTEQDKSMGLDQMTNNIRTCAKSELYPMDLWGGEWWYWRHLNGDRNTPNLIRTTVNQQPP